MKLPCGFGVGTATHTGWVRSNNEDDFLVGAPPHRGEPSRGGDPLLLCASADGRGGAAGGAEGSRIALRALSPEVLDPAGSATVEQRLARGFALAGERVYAESTAVPALRDMGTTLTALCVDGTTMRLGHVGDTRAYRCRDGRCEQLTEDHAAREHENLLLRCIGGGKPDSEVDFGAFPLRAGDRYVLATDGVWSTMGERDLARLTARGSAQQAADALVAAALQAGGPDNATAVVVDVLDPAAKGEREVELPRDERPSGRELWPKPASLRAPVWPWVLWTVALVLLVAAALRWWWDVDLWGWVGGWFG